MTGADDLARVFQMIPWLGQHPDIEVQTAARHFGITPERLIDELNQLSMFDLAPSQLEAGDLTYLVEFYADDTAETGRISLGTSEYLNRPLRVAPDEAASLIVALDSLTSLVDESSMPALVSARHKLVELLGRDEAPVRVAVESASDEVRRLLREAIAGRRRVQLTYDGVNRGHTTHPVVDPVTMLTIGGAVYLQAWSQSRQDWRLYKANRINAVCVLDDPAEVHGQPPEVEGPWFSGQHLDQVVLDLSAGARYLAEYDPVIEQHELGPDQAPWVLRVRMGVAGPSFLTARLLQLGDAVRVVEPAHAGHAAAEVAQGALEAYASLEQAPLPQPTCR